MRAVISVLSVLESFALVAEMTIERHSRLLVILLFSRWLCDFLLVFDSEWLVATILVLF